MLWMAGKDVIISGGGGGGAVRNGMLGDGNGWMDSMVNAHRFG